MRPKLIRGVDLTPEQVSQVLAAFSMRNTKEKPYIAPRPQSAIKTNTVMMDDRMSDDEWVKKHAFYITRAGNLAKCPAKCEPHWWALLD